jgi:hypothetical protein
MNSKPLTIFKIYQRNLHEKNEANITFGELFVGLIAESY